MGKSNASNSYKYYAVSKGKTIGIYDNWCIAEKQVNGYSGAVYKGFNTIRQAEGFMSAANITNAKHYLAVTMPPEVTDQLNSTWDLEQDIVNSKASSTPDRVSATSTTSTSASASSEREQTLPSVSKVNRRDAGSCTNCAKLEEIIMTLNERLSKLESLIANQNSSSQFKLAELSAKVFQIQKAIDNPSPSSSSPHQTEASHIKQRPSATEAPADDKTRTKHTNQTEFKPERCIVIGDLNKETANLLNQDIIRRTISQKFGPIIIDLINRYKHNTTNPKYIVQFADPTVIPTILSGWDCHTLRGTTVRRTITPTPNSHIAMARGVPLDLSDDDLAAAADDMYPGCSTYRLRSKTGTPLRTVKLEFTTREERDGAIQNGLKIDIHHLLLRVELPYNA